jgi:hypothetical protein
MSTWIVPGSDPSVGPVDRMGSVLLTWTLSAAPDPSWVNDFNTASVSYSGPGTLDFMAIANPMISGAGVSWRVPEVRKDHAEQYILQRVRHANSKVTSQGEISAVAEYVLSCATSEHALGISEERFIEKFDHDVLLQTGPRSDSIGAAVSEAMTSSEWPWK